MREDLAALSVEAVAALSNWGLTKRAQREIAEGKGPEIEEDGAGVVTGRFPDGASVRWPPATSLRDAACTCSGAPACRHRVGLALAYAARATAAPGGPEGGVAPAGRAPSTIDTSWSPAGFDDAELAKHLGARVMAAAQAARARGMLARVRPPSSTEPIASVALPTCTVRFLAPRQLAFARCDCEIGEGCAHVALAVWAFRAAGDAEGERVVARSLSDHPSDLAALEPLRALGRWALGAGVSGLAGADALPQRAALARLPLVAGGYVWMVALLDELVAAIAAYRDRSASYRSLAMFEIVSEIEARSRSAAAPPHALPPGAILGQGTPFETRLDHVRLVSLGARLTTDGSSTHARVLLANPETGDVFGLDRTFDGEPRELGELAPRRLAGSTIGGLAVGQVVTRSAVRRANGELVLKSGAPGVTSVTPQRGDFASMPTSRRIEGAAALEAHLAARPPGILRPRRLGEDVVVLAIDEVGPLGFDVAEQALFVRVSLVEGGSLLLLRRHGIAAPRALDVLAAALEGTWGEVRWVAGDLTRGAGDWILDPTMVVADRLIVPDLEPAPSQVHLARARLDRPAPAAGRVLAEVVERMGEAAHTGLDVLDATFTQRLERAGAAAGAIGLASVHARVESLVGSVRRRAPDRAERWADAAIRVRLAVERA